jgi:hypothetical protein
MIPSPRSLNNSDRPNPSHDSGTDEGIGQVRAHFPWPNVYYAGSHEGCGCGFAYNQMPEHLQEADDEARRRASVAALREYVTTATALGPMQLFACWEGEQSFPEKDRVTVSPDVLGGEAFDLEQLRMLEFPARDSRDRAATEQQNPR